MTTILKTKNLSKVYGEGVTAVEALKPTNLDIKKGEFVVLVGPSGSGKSTLLQLLGGIDTPSGGKVILDGEDVYSLSEKKLSIFRRKKIGFIFQGFNLIPIFSAEENVTLPILLGEEEVDQKYIDEIFELLGMDTRKNHLPNALSGGQQQRVAIGRALANKPSIIFADEPTGNLDSKTSQEVLDLLKESIKKYNQTMVMVTHDPKLKDYADRIITIKDGKILEEG